MVEELLARPMEGLSRISQEQWRVLRDGGVISTAFGDHGRFRTPSGKIMIYNENLEEPMPRYVKSHGGAYPLRLVAVPSAFTLNSVFMDREDLNSGRGPMTLMLHPADGAARKIKDGSRVIAFNELGEVEFTAKITPLVARGTAAAQGVYDRTSTKDGLLVNALHHERLSDIGAATTLNDNTVDVRPC